MWTVRVSDTANADFDEILRWTAKRFGKNQAHAYAALTAEAAARLEGGPAIRGARQRGEIGTGLSTRHVGRRGWHIILFRVSGDQNEAVDVLRILHDAIDLARHVPEED